MRTIRLWHLLVAFALIMLLVIGGASSALASDIRSGDTITIPAGQIIDDDLVVFANQVVIDGTVNGDLVAFGNTIVMNGTVNGSAMMGGQTLAVRGTIKGTLYAGGGALTLAHGASLERNLMFAGYSLQAETESAIARDLAFAGSQAVLNGNVGRDIRAAGQALELNGQVGRNVRADVAEPNQMPFNMVYGPNMPPAIPSGLRVSEGASIGGQLTYSSSVEQSSTIMTQPKGGVSYQAVLTNTNVPAPSPYEWLWTRVRDFFTVLILGALALWLIPRWTNTAAINAQTKPLASAGWGLLVLIAGYILAVVAVIAVFAIAIAIGVTTLGGLAFATFGLGFGATSLLTAAFTAVVLWGAKVIVSLLVGKLLLQLVAKNYADNKWLAFLIGLIIFEIVAAIPILGFFVTLATVLLGLGAIWYVYYERRNAPQVPVARPAPMPA